MIDGELLEQVEKYKYLGSVLAQDIRCKEEIKTRMVIAKTAFNKVKALILNRSKREFSQIVYKKGLNNPYFQGRGQEKNKIITG